MKTSTPGAKIIPFPGQRHIPSAKTEINALVESPDALARVRALPSPLLHRMITQVGLYDSAELLALATPEQVREVIDLDIWDRDRVKLPEAVDWLHFMTTLPDDVRMRDLRALDVELVGYVLKQHLKIYLLHEDENEVPEEPEGTLFGTPDGWFALDVIADHEATVDQVMELIHVMYADNADDIRKLLQNLMWELPTELEDWAYRWRTGRLADLGFADAEEALLVYAYLAPDQIEADERTVDRPLTADPEPSGAATELARISSLSDSFWSRVLATIKDPDERARLGTSAMHLSNRALAADRVAPADLDQAQRSLDALHWRLSVGLEYLAAGDEGHARQLLSHVALLRIARVGYSLPLDIRKPIAVAARAARLGPKAGALDYLDHPLREPVRALLTSRPLWVDADGISPRPFASRADLAAARATVELAIATADLAQAMQLPGPTVEADLAAQRANRPVPTFGDRFRTAVVNRVLARSGPLDAAALATLLASHVTAGKLTQALWQTALSMAPSTVAGQDIAKRFLGELEAFVGGLSAEDLDLRFVDGLWLAADGESPELSIP